MLDQNFYYHSSIKKYIIAFSHIFSDIHINRTTSTGALVKDVVIPISFGQKQKLFSILERNGNIDRKIDTFLPRLDFSLESIEPDPTRQRNVINTIDAITDDVSNFTHSGVAYNLNFDVHLICKYLDDMYQAIEQVLSVFGPDYHNLDVELIPELNISHNVKVLLTGVTIDVNSDLGEDDYRTCEANFTFQLQGYLYKPIQSIGIIKTVIVDLDNEVDKTWSILTASLDE